jgi:TetR/AcrR family transcriptional regulator, transcriptional repressor of bet genes
LTHESIGGKKERRKLALPGKKAPEEQRREQILAAGLKVAQREHLENFTMQQVAQEAGLSKGLLFFHFKSKDDLVVALLDWLLDNIFEVWETSPELPPKERLLALLAHDLEDVYQQEEQAVTKVELFFAFWVLGLRNPAIGERIQAAVARAKRNYLPVVLDLIESEPARFAGVTPESLVEMLAGLVQGCALQALLSGKRPDLRQLLRAQRALLLPPE